MVVMEHKKTKRNRRSNPVPFEQRLIASFIEAERHLDWSRRTTKRLIAEGAIDSVVIGHRRYVVVASLLRALERGRGVQLPEPIQLQRANTGTV
jgi:hypothetical protein